MRDVGADLGGSGSGVKADSDAAARRRKMTIQLREARRSLSEPDAIPSHSSAMVRLFAEINRSATPMLGIIALGVCATALAWLEAGQLNPNLEDILARIEKATRLEPNNTRIRWYRGLVLKRLGKNGKAVGEFRFVVENDPRHVDAQREIRLYEMRRAEMRRTGQKIPSDRPSGGPPGPSSNPPASDRSKTPDGGRFGKWFKR